MLLLHLNPVYLLMDSEQVSMQWNKVHLSLCSICKLHRPTPVTRQHRFSMYSGISLGSGGGGGEVVGWVLHAGKPSICWHMNMYVIPIDCTGESIC